MWLTILSSWLIFLTISCKHSNRDPSIKDRVNESSKVSEGNFEQLPTDFMEFYYKFHSDSLFQMSSIFFPLEGLPNHADPEFIANEKFFWSPDQWEFQKQIVKNNKDYSANYINVSDMLVEETITELKSGLKLIRRFAKTGSGWRLIYYAGMNKYSNSSK